MMANKTQMVPSHDNGIIVSNEIFALQPSTNFIHSNVSLFGSKSREQFPRNFLVSNVTRKLATCFEEVGNVERVIRMLQGC